MPQPTFVQKIDGSSAAAHSLTLTPGSITGSAQGELLLVGVVLTPTGAQSPQQVAGIIDSAGTPVVGSPGISTGVPVNSWAFLGSSNDDVIRMEWWACKGPVPITWLTINITGTGVTGEQAIIAFMLEYSSASGVSFPNFQALVSNQNTITGQYILETAATYPNSASELMIGLFSMLNDTFNASPPTPSTPTLGEQTVRSTNSLSIPPALSYQVIEQGNEYPGNNNVAITIGGETLTLAGAALNITAESATQLATAVNVANSSMQCLYIVISSGLILNTPPGFSDRPDASVAAGNYALGLQLAKISGNAALGMCRMESFQGIYTNGQTVDLPVSPVDGYHYQRNELIYIWGIYNTANPSTQWLTGPCTLWYCGWNVDQETGSVTCDEWYRNIATSGDSQDGTLVVFTIGQRQQQTLTAAVKPTWSQQQASTFVTDLAYSTDVLVALNNNSKFAVLAQECLSMGEFYTGETVPTPVSPADGYAYAYSEVKFVFSWRWTTLQGSYVAPPWTPDEQLGSMFASVSSIGAVTVKVGWAQNSGENYNEESTDGRIAVFAFCQRTRTGTPAVVANKFAEIPNSLFYPGNPLPAGIGAQLVNNINEAALSPEFFGPTTYSAGATVPCPTSPVDGYVYQRSEMTYIWEWGLMAAPQVSYPFGSGQHVRSALFLASINQTSGLVSMSVQRYAPGGPYVEYISSMPDLLSVMVVGFRSSQQTALSAAGSSAPSDAGSAVGGDQLSPGAVTVNGG